MALIKIPQQCGAILLPNAVSFPHSSVPLHIFEPRYRKMLEDAFEDEFMICIGNLLTEETEDPALCTAKIGTIGLIRMSREQEDGRSNLVLHSVSRVEFQSWDLNSVYPKAMIKPLPSIPLPNIQDEVSEDTELLVKSLRHAADQILARLPEEWATEAGESLDLVNDDLATLTDVIAAQFLGDNQLKQALLEELDPAIRAEVLTRHLRTL